MLMSGPMDALPLWGLFGATVVIALLSIEAGYRIGEYRRRHSEEEKEGPVGAIVAATLGLLGFVLAFTFGLAASRFDARRQIVVEEANAIGTTYLRAGLLPDDRGVKIRKLLREYTDARLEAVETGNIDKVLQRSDELHRELWKEAEAVGKQHPNSIVVGLFIQSLNDTIDIHAKRILVSLQSRVPGVFWGALLPGHRSDHGWSWLSRRIGEIKTVPGNRGAGRDLFGHHDAGGRSRPSARGVHKSQSASDDRAPEHDEVAMTVLDVPPPTPINIRIST